MFFRVNGAAVYARGAIKVPMDLMEGRMTAAAHHRLVQSAVEANFNTIRVWGGGIWEPRAFLEAADELGVLIYGRLHAHPLLGRLHFSLVAFAAAIPLHPP